MFVRQVIFAICSIFVFGCSEPSTGNNEKDEIVSNLVSAGFRVDDITVVGELVYAGRDAVVSLQASREMLQDSTSGKEQYRTNNLVGTEVIKICIDGPAFTGTFGTALDLAIQNYDEQPLRFGMARVPAFGCDFTIRAVLQSGLDGGSAGFPSLGYPFGQINIGDTLDRFGVDTLESVITHELGHTIGLRHSDFFDRSISCGGAASNEGGGGIGAILIPGTPSGAVVGGSIMNSCFRPSETGEFTGSDITALTTLYPVVAGVCTPGTFRTCCPFPTGCSCLGTQRCNADAQWGSCSGAGRKGQPCP